MYGMQKTTVYLPDDLKSALERASKALQRSEADLIREGVQLVAQSYMAPEPRLPLFESDDPSLARHVDDALAGFGER
jgi:Arc/MetJ-type ribon-helix-helix transcriptional regulator